MDDATFTRESFRATIAFGLLALLGLLLAALWYGTSAAVACALLAIGAAYVSQLLATLAQAFYKLRPLAVVAQVASCGLWVIGFALLALWRA